MKNLLCSPSSANLQKLADVGSNLYLFFVNAPLTGSLLNVVLVPIVYFRIPQAFVESSFVGTVHCLAIHSL